MNFRLYLGFARPLAQVMQCAFALMFVLVAGQAFAQTALRSFDHLKTGFPLTGVHVSQRCESCHVSGVFKGTPKDCTSCHTNGLRISRSNTLKPANHIPTQLSCDTCHNTQGFTPARFHGNVIVSSQCSSCHNGSFPPAGGKPATPIHAGVTNCEACHKTTGWAGARADHGAFTAATNCASCHNGSTATGKPGNHLATTANCGTCHSTNLWTGAKIDHGTFSAATNCASCHNGAAASGKPAVHIPTASNCISCHATTAWKPSSWNHTQANVANQCSTCHSGAHPPADGRNANHTPYERLTGVAIRSCDTCHKAGYSAWAPAKFHSSVAVSNQCATCHSGIKPATPIHAGVTNCETCHKTTGWAGARVDHSAFTTTTNCTSCHNGTAATGKPGNHIPTAGNCVSCHATAAWKPSKFNHTQAAVVNQCAICHSGAFPPADGRTVNHVPYQSLAGAAISSCDTCHKAGFAAWSPVKFHASVSVSAQCSTCHNGSFLPAVGKPGTPIHTGVTNCESCHKTTGWAGAKIDHSTFTAATTCATCHNGSTATGKPAAHIPVGAANCISCHGTTAWRPSRFNHTQTAVANQCSTCHSGAFPPADGRPVTHIPYQALTGVAIANCDTCHKAGYAAWAPARLHSSVSVSAQCVSCHNGSFPPAVGKPNTPIHTGVNNCESCHRTTGWAGAKVNHSTFTAATNCATCHNGTTATGKSARHIPVGAANCISCHGITTWLPSRFNHTQVIVNNQCSTCHSGAYPPADARPPSHIPYQTLTGVVITNCDTCHRGGFAAWAPARFHGSVTVVGQCAGCHTGLFAPARGRPNTPVHVGVTNCETCHRSTASWLTVVFAHSPANGVGTGTCDTCHNGATAKGKTPTHIPVVGGLAKCDACHRSQVSFAGATMNHSVVTTSTCKGCHNGGYVSQGKTGALAKPANHIPEAQLLNGSSMDCSSCHTGTTSWTTLRMNHNNSLGGGAGSCKACHATGSNYLGNMQKKALTHRSKTPPAIDCSESGCHRPLGNRGSTYANWN